MIDQQLFNQQYAEGLEGQALVDARIVLIETLSKFAGLSFSLVPEECLDSIWRTGIKGQHGSGYLSVSWQGIIGASDYRNDGTLVYDATMFPVIGGFRVLASKDLNENYHPTYAFRYATISIGSDWTGSGWLPDEFDEYVGWYADPESTLI